MKVYLRLSRNYYRTTRLPLYVGQFDQESSTAGIDESVAWINNAIIVLGASYVELATSPPAHAPELAERLVAKYPQVLTVSEEYFEQRPILDLVSFEELSVPSSAVISPTARISRAEPSTEVMTAGINIGQTSLKVAICQGHRILEGSCLTAQTWDDSQPRTTAALVHKLHRLLMCAIQQSGVYKSELQGIGIGISTIVRPDGRMLRHGVALGMDDFEYVELCRLGETFAASLGLPCVIEQDAITKAYAASVVQNISSGLIVDMGTSTGGSFTDAEGNVPEILGQIGRVVIDTSADAVPRPDGGGTGCVSQYLSATGMLRIARMYGLDISDTAQLEERVDDASAQTLVASLTQYLFATLEAVARVYHYDRVVLTGGMVSGKLGSLLLDEASRKVDAVPALVGRTFVISSAPRFDTCIGASVQRQLELPVTTTRTAGGRSA